MEDTDESKSSESQERTTNEVEIEGQKYKRIPQHQVTWDEKGNPVWKLTHYALVPE